MDIELLELAAKAAGMVVHWNYRREQFFHDYCDGLTDEWNPLTDDGDALRLAVKLKLCIFRNDDVSWVATGSFQTVRAEEVNGTDPYAATRRAIVRAAAEIGRRM